MLGVIALFIKREGRRPSLYELRPALLSDGELAFYRALLAAVSDRYLIAPKVRVADVLKVARTAPRKSYASAFNRIAMKHFDFVLCDPRTLAFIAAIELDDKSHHRGERVVRDEFLSDAAAAAKLTLHRFGAKAAYTVPEIREALLPRAIESEFAARLSGGRIEPTL